MRDLKEIINNLTSENVITIMARLGAEPYKETDDEIIFPTICHNEDASQASPKLYYYKTTKSFHCYTQCSDTFDIFELLKRYYETRNITYNWYNDIYKVLEEELPIQQFYEPTYKSEAAKYQKPIKEIQLSEVSYDILDVFRKKYCEEWIEEGITQETMDKYHILYYPSQNKIIIPHYDINGRLIGIRGRALNENEIKLFGKYMPVQIEGKWYTHPLSLNLYGLYQNKENINKTGKVVIFEAEKSVLKMENTECNNSVAICGSNFNKMQLNLLLYNTKINEVIIALDKEYTSDNLIKKNSYFNKLHKICKKYNKYYKFSFIWDENNLLEEKDSPIDKGEQVFHELMEKRIVVE